MNSQVDFKNKNINNNMRERKPQFMIDYETGFFIKRSTGLARVRNNSKKWEIVGNTIYTKDDLKTIRKEQIEKEFLNNFNLDYSHENIAKKNLMKVLKQIPNKASEITTKSQYNIIQNFNSFDYVEKSQVSQKRYGQLGAELKLNENENFISRSLTLSTLLAENKFVGTLRKQVLESNKTNFKIQIKMTVQGRNKNTNEFTSREVYTKFTSFNKNDNLTDLIKNKFNELATIFDSTDLYALKNIRFSEFFMNVHTSKSLQGSSYIEIPKMIKNKKCCVNVKNNDPFCVIWSILSFLYPVENHNDRPSMYKKYFEEHIENLKEKFNFPLQTIDIPRIAKYFKIHINLFRYIENENNFTLSPFKWNENEIEGRKNMNMLIYGNDNDMNEDKNDDVNFHYVWIKKPLESFYDDTRCHNEMKVCLRCNQRINKTKFETHIRDCNGTHSVLCEMPNDLNLNFKNYSKKHESPIVFYFDCETYGQIENNNDEDKKTKVDNIHKPYSVVSYCLTKKYDYSKNDLLKYKDKINKFYSFQELKIFKGENSMIDYLNYMKNKENEIFTFYRNNTEMTDVDEEQFKQNNICHICKKSIKKDTEKVKDHDHITGKYRGVSHNNCNLQYSPLKNHIPCFAHNLKGYDSHLIFKYIHELKEKGKIQVIANTIEKYMTFSIGQIRFLDSCQFLNFGLEKLVETMRKSKIEFKHTTEFYKNHFYFKNNMDELYKKQVYAYSFAKSIEDYEKSHFPCIDDFFNTLTYSKCNEKDYEHAQKMYKILNCKNWGDYTIFYNILDVLLLADVFEYFRQTMRKNFDLDPVNYFTLPSFANDAMYKDIFEKQGENIVQLPKDIDTMKFIKRGIRGGISMIKHRYAKANNKYMTEQFSKMFNVPVYNPNEKSSYIIYLDCNSLYPSAMIQKMPVSNFEYVQNVDAFKWYDLKDDGEIGCLLECHLSFPKLDEKVNYLGREINGQELQDILRDYPPIAENKSIMEEDLSNYQKDLLNETTIIKQDGTEEKVKNIRLDKTEKLICDFTDKKFYVCHYRIAKFWRELGIKVEPVRILKFRQEYIMRDYINKCVELRKKADIEKNEINTEMFKLCMNATFGKQMEDVLKRKSVDVVDVNEEDGLKQKEKLIGQTRFQDIKDFGEGLFAIQREKNKVVLNKPIFIGQCILDNSKLIMLKFWYKILKEKYNKQDQLRLLMTDTDSLLFKVETEDYFNEMMEHKEHLDLSKMDNVLFKDLSNQKQLSKFKDESNGLPIYEFVGLRSKLYSYISIQRDEDKKLILTESKKAKGVSKSSVKKFMKFDEYYSCIVNKNIIEKETISIRSKNHQLMTLKINKSALSSFDDKNYILDDGITTYPYGYYKISK